MLPTNPEQILGQKPTVYAPVNVSATFLTFGTPVPRRFKPGKKIPLFGPELYGNQLMRSIARKSKKLPFLPKDDDKKFSRNTKRLFRRLRKAYPKGIPKAAWKKFFKTKYPKLIKVTPPSPPVPAPAPKVETK